MYLRYIRSLVLIILILLILVTYKNYTNLYKFRDFSYSPDVKKKLIFEALLDTRSDIFRIFDNLFKIDKEINFKKVYLTIKNGDLDKARDKWVNKTLLGDKSDNRYFNASINLNNSNKFQKSSFRFRGKSDWHLRLEKPSLRIKLKNYQTYKMMKHLNITFPEGRGVIENYYANMLAREFGLIGHYGELIELYINNINYGVYHLHSREDESLVRINNRMPAPIISGQNLKINKWKIEDFEEVNFESIKRNHDIFGKMIKELYSDKNNYNDWENLWNIINFEQTAKYVALKTILGVIHDDYWHNHEFFYDRTMGKIEPILNDAQSLGTNLYPGGEDRISLKTFFSKDKPDYRVPINQKTNPFFNAIISDTYFYHKKNQIIQDMIINNLSVSRQHKLISKIYDNIDQFVYKDKEKRYLVERVNGWQIAKSSNYQYEIYKKNIFEYIENRNSFLTNELKKNFFDYNFIELEEFPGQNFLKIKYKGELPLSMETYYFGNSQIYNTNKKIFIDIKKDKLLFHTGLAIAENQNKLTNKKIGNDIFHDHHYITEYQTYLVKLDTNTNINQLEKYFLTFKDVKFQKRTSKKLSIKEIEFNELTTHIWSKDTSKSEDVIFDSGNHDIKEDIFIGKNQKLIVMDGANLFLWPDVSIFSEGKVEMDGNIEGINIKNKFMDKPWGNISIFGKYSNNSFIKKTVIEGGSTKDINNILFSGMLNIFWNENIILENLKISNNDIGDDTLHITKSKGVINNLEIYDCLSDCIDLDYSSYIIKNLDCYNSLNDGLDLMESSVEGSNLNFSKNKDKSISVGESSILKVDNLKIINSNIGVASKDDSMVNIKNLLVKDTNLGLDSYRKNSRYQNSGNFDIVKSQFIGNRLDLRFIDRDQILFDFQNLNYLQN